MANNHDYIAAVCQKLAQEGHKPSVALIKKAAGKPLPLPEIIAVLQRWSQDPGQFKSMALSPPEQKQSSTQTPEDNNLRLEQRVAKLEQMVKELLIRLEQAEKN